MIEAREEIVVQELSGIKENIAFLQKSLESEPAEIILGWALEAFGNRAAIASSFGADDVVLIDMAVKINPDVRIFTLDTGRLPYETYDLMDRVRDKYGVNIEVCFPDKNRIQEMVEAEGFNLFYKNVSLRQLCCRVRKVEPLKEKLRELDAWICGLRRDQAVTRTDVKKVEIDAFGGDIIKVNPLADWNEELIWDYIRKNGVPYNKLHDRNYPSIGCAPCTRAIEPGEDIRAGRWWWENPEMKECGLHKRG